MITKFYIFEWKNLKNRLNLVKNDHDDEFDSC